jgi:hypothetical protein
MGEMSNRSLNLFEVNVRLEKPRESIEESEQVQTADQSKATSFSTPRTDAEQSCGEFPNQASRCLCHCLFVIFIIFLFNDSVNYD